MLRPRHRKVRLNKFIASNTALSRRAADDAISKGLVKIGDQTVTKLGVRIDPSREVVFLNGKRLCFKKRRPVVIAFNKPKNCLVSKFDPRGRLLIWDLLPPLYLGLNAAGRLDFASEGLILLTNNGEILNRITHPSTSLVKTYNVKVEGHPNNDKLRRLKDGIVVDGVRVCADEATIMRRSDSNTWLTIKIHQGRYRQIRRMCRAIGHPVVRLKRTAVGPIKLGSLRPGGFRQLKRNELLLLCKLLKLDKNHL